MAFLDLSFPHGVARGAVGGPQRAVDIVSLASGAEERNARWRDSRRSFDVGLGIRDLDDLSEVVALFEEAGGQLHSFRFRDWSDHWSGLSSRSHPSASDQGIGTGDGAAVAFQLVKRYGRLKPYDREITKPVPGTVRVSVGGVPVASGWSVDHLSGVVRFAVPPPVGAEIRAGFLFDVPVRFDADAVALDLAFFSANEGHGLGSVPSISLIEVRE